MTDEVVVVAHKASSITDDVLNKALEYVERTAEFVGEQAPLLVQEILNYGLFNALFWAGFWGVAFGAVVYGAVRLYHFAVLHSHDDDGFPGIMLGIFCGGGTLAGCFVCLFKAAKIIIAPRLYLIEKLGDLL